MSLRMCAALPGGSPRSRYWKVRAGASRRDLYLFHEGMGAAHVSLHGDQKWHVDVGDRYLDLGIAPEIMPGVRHAISVVMAPSACTISEPAGDRVQVVQLIQERDLRCGVLDVFLNQDPSEVEVVPGGAAPTWQQPLGDTGAVAQIFARAQRVPAIELAIEGPQDQVAAALASVAAGEAEVMPIFPAQDRRPVVILDGMLLPSVT